MYYVYAITSLKDSRIYVGLTHDVQNRLKNHNLGMTFSTKGFRPWKLFFCEEVGDSRLEARKREKYFKSGCGKEFLKSIR